MVSYYHIACYYDKKLIGYVDTCLLYTSIFSPVFEETPFLLLYKSFPLLYTLSHIFATRRKTVAGHLRMSARP